jgi:DNA polymerase III subunit epsilon
MTLFDEPALQHDGRCTFWTSSNPEDCDCRDAQGKTPREPLSWIDGPLCPFDLESTGKDPRTARVVTATVVRVRPGHDTKVTNWLTDVGGEEIPDEAAGVHKITTEHAREHGRPIAEVIQEVRAQLELAWSLNIPVAGANLSYDLTLMAAECERLGLPPFKVTGPVVDCLVIDRGVDRYRRGSRKLIDLCKHYGIALSEEDAHASDADAIAAARVVWKIAKRYPEIGRMALADLMDWQRNAHRAWAENFGAYLARQGKPDDVERSWPMRGTA